MNRPYSVRLLVSALAAGESDNDGVQLQANQHFVAESATYMVLGTDLAGVAETATVKPLIVVNLKDNEDGQGIFSHPVPLTSIAGDGKNPFIFNRPLRFNSKPYVEAENISSDQAYTRVYLVLHGYLQSNGA